MRLSLLVQSAPLSTPAACVALRFASAAVAAGHTVQRVFFYKDAAAIGNRFAADDDGVRQSWAALAEQASFELAICIAAAGRRGVVEGESLAEGFAIVGLGQLVEAMEQSDRLVTF